jgi:hypothetical protein
MVYYISTFEGTLLSIKKRKQEKEKMREKKRKQSTICAN